jgi:beta-galactosidase GanA
MCNKIAGNAEWNGETAYGEEEKKELFVVKHPYALGRVVNMNFKYLETSGCPEYRYLPFPILQFGKTESAILNCCRYLQNLTPEGHSEHNLIKKCN